MHVSHPMTTRIAPGVGANLLGQHSAERNQDATAYVGNLDPQVPEDLLWELFLQAGPVGMFHFSLPNAIVYKLLSIILLGLDIVYKLLFQLMSMFQRTESPTNIKVMVLLNSGVRKMLTM